MTSRRAHPASSPTAKERCDPSRTRTGIAVAQATRSHPPLTCDGGRLSQRAASLWWLLSWPRPQSAVHENEEVSRSLNGRLMLLLPADCSHTFGRHIAETCLRVAAHFAASDRFHLWSGLKAGDCIADNVCIDFSDIVTPRAARSNAYDRSEPNIKMSQMDSSSEGVEFKPRRNHGMLAIQGFDHAATISPVDRVPIEHGADHDLRRVDRPWAVSIASDNRLRHEAVGGSCGKDHVVEVSRA
jgi:hypothetical protein